MRLLARALLCALALAALSCDNVTPVHAPVIEPGCLELGGGPVDLLRQSEADTPPVCLCRPPRAQ